MTCTLTDGRKFLAEVKGSDTLSDLAVLQIDRDVGSDQTPLPEVTLGDSQDLQARHKGQPSLEGRTGGRACLRLCTGRADGALRHRQVFGSVLPRVCAPPRYYDICFYYASIIWHIKRSHAHANKTHALSTFSMPLATTLRRQNVTGTNESHVLFCRVHVRGCVVISVDVPW